MLRCGQMVEIYLFKDKGLELDDGCRKIIVVQLHDEFYTRRKLLVNDI